MNMMLLKLQISGEFKIFESTTTINAKFDRGFGYRYRRYQSIIIRAQNKNVAEKLKKIHRGMNVLVLGAFDLHSYENKNRKIFMPAIVADLILKASEYKNVSPDIWKKIDDCFNEFQDTIKMYLDIGKK